MKICKLLPLLLLSGELLHGQRRDDDFELSVLNNAANGENAPLVGSIIPDDITFAMSPTPASTLINLPGALANSSLIPDLENRSYSDFPNEVVITVYHTPW